MFKNLIVGVDGRAGGRDAIALASCLAGSQARLTLVHVHPRGRPASRASDERLGHDREASRALLEQERAEAGVDAELLSAEASSPARGLHEQAEHLRADLLVVGPSSRSGLGRAILGDDTRASLNGAPCAVAIAAGGFAQRPSRLATVGVAYDSSPESEAALAAARRLAEHASAELRAMEVVAIPTIAYSGMMPPAIGDSINEMLSEASDRLEQLEGVAARAVYGLPGEMLVGFSDELDLLVVGSRGYGPVKRLVLGSTSDYLARHAHCSLVVLPRPAIEAAGPAGAAGERAEAPLTSAA